MLLRVFNECDGCSAEELEKQVKQEVSNANGMGKLVDDGEEPDFELYVTEFLIPHIHLTVFFRFVGPQFYPVAAILGGVIGQEAIKAISQDGIPLKNLFLYSALDNAGIVCDLPLSG